MTSDAKRVLKQEGRGVAEKDIEHAFTMTGRVASTKMGT